jgi:hypothetical protein
VEDPLSVVIQRRSDAGSRCRPLRRRFPSIAVEPWLELSGTRSLHRRSSREWRAANVERERNQRMRSD